jgi:hypothetical protein
VQRCWRVRLLARNHPHEAARRISKPTITMFLCMDAFIDAHLLRIIPRLEPSLMRHGCRNRLSPCVLPPRPCGGQEASSRFRWQFPVFFGKILLF